LAGSKISTLARSPAPPAISTRPSGSSVALCPTRVTLMIDWSGRARWTAGSHRSASLRAAGLPPPAISTRPSLRSVVVCLERGENPSVGKGSNVPVPGMNRSGAEMVRPRTSTPPRMSTEPSDRSVAVCHALGVSGAAANREMVPSGRRIAASVGSASLPTSSTLPSGSSVSDCPAAARSVDRGACSARIGA
jgi:hypothetical protein